MTIERSVHAVAWVMVIGATALADDVQNYFVARVSTELHRATVPSSADTYAVVNCNSLIIDNGIDLSALDTDRFIAALTAATANRSHLTLVCRYQMPATIDKQLSDRLNQRLKEISAVAGYKNVGVSEVTTSEDWLDAYLRADLFSPPGDLHEPLIENEYVRVYPVRTRLSKFLFGKVDCIVEIVHPIDGRMKEIHSDLESSIRQAVQAAQIVEKHTILFKLSCTTAGQAQVKILFNARSAPKVPEPGSPDFIKFLEYKRSPALALAQDLGFQKITWSITSAGDAPETLVGEKAPNFTLRRLDGDDLELHEFIHDRPALITFWGLACAECKQEAPSLSALHEKYRKEFSIVAVNAYDDSLESVAKYAMDEGLTHPIVVQGKTVADELYHVGAYPMTFWVDHKGTIIDYEVGFTSSQRLEGRIKDLLER